MLTRGLNSQSGYVLILTVLMFMGVGGVVLAGFTQQAKQDLEVKRYQHNQRVLRQAKQALLMFAYNYPQTDNGGPGRLPCPDHDNNGTIDFPLVCNTVGRFPFADPRLNTPELLDASGERLWYAVSGTFDNSGATIINSDVTGSITLVDQSENILYDGAVGGIAAVVIAPGPISKRDNDNNGIYEFTQLRDTTGPGGQQRDPRNYLDTYNGFDNSVFVNGGNNPPDGFILGPIIDKDSSMVAINDQLIVITTEEVLAMAEKAVLDNYKNALDNYQNNVWAGIQANYRYPWLNAYADIVAGADLNVIDAEAGETVGRMPYLNYFTDHDSHVVVTDLQVAFDMTLTSLTDSDDADDPTYIDAFTPVFNALFFNGTVTLDIDDANLSFEQKKFDGSDDIRTDDIGTMISAAGGTPNAPPTTGVITRYFWDGGCGGCMQPQDGWEVCPVINGDETDCARDNATGTVFEQPFLGWNSHADIRIRVVRLILSMDEEFTVEFDYSIPPTSVTYDSAPDAANHARFTTEHDVASVTVVSLADSLQTNARNFVDITVDMCEQDNEVGSNFNIPSFNPDGGSAFCTIDMSSAFNVNQFDVTADYYPELPLWVSLNQWNDAVLMAYADDYSPTGGQDCVVTGPCLSVDHNYGGLTIDNAAVLLGAGQIPAVFGDLANNFEGENSTPLDDNFDAQPANSDDTILVIDDF